MKSNSSIENPSGTSSSKQEKETAPNQEEIAVFLNRISAIKRTRDNSKFDLEKYKVEQKKHKKLELPYIYTEIMEATPEKMERNIEHYTALVEHLDQTEIIKVFRALDRLRYSSWRGDQTEFDF